MKNIILIILLTFPFIINAQSKLSINPQVGISDFRFNDVPWGSFSEFRDYRNVLYLGIDVSLEKELFKNFKVLGNIGFTKNGMRGKAFKEEFELDKKIYLREIWSNFSVYNLRLSTNFEYNIRDIISVGTGIQYVREITAYEIQQEVWLSNFYDSDQFFKAQAAKKYDNFRKNNFYGNFYLKHFVAPKLAISVGVNVGLNSIVPYELYYYTRPFEYYVGFHFYPFKKPTSK